MNVKKTLLFAVLLIVPTFAGEKIKHLGVDSRSNNRIEVRFTTWNNVYYLDRTNDMFNEYFTLLSLAKSKGYYVDWEWYRKNGDDSQKYIKYISISE